MANGSHDSSALGLPSLAAFASAATEADLVALTVPIPFDHETAVSLADRFIDEPYLFVLESATSAPNARYSFVGFDPLWTWEWSRADACSARVCEGHTVQTLAVGGGNPITGLREYVQRHRLCSVYADNIRIGGPDVALMAGAAGFFGYDVAAALEPSVGEPPPKRLGLPDAFFFVPKVLLVLDHLSRRLFVSRIVPTGSLRGGGLRSLYETEIRRLQGLLRMLTAVHSPPPLLIDDLPPDYETPQQTFSKPDFLAAAERCLEEIRSGEIFQIQIGNRLSVRTEARPFDVFRHLRMLNPSPYMFFYKIGEQHILGASPEMMVGVQGRRVTHRPIAGTRRRSWDPAKDARMRRELTESEKERAEHVMLVDLGRNDVGRIAAPGTVAVEELMVVEEYSHVFHMVSQVAGDLAAGKDAFDALIAGFPNGTVSGAPKIRAMQLINAIEPVSREFYAGSLGLFDFAGNLRSTILIRSIHIAHGIASTQASAGIVYDSIPEEEWLETKNKMAACLIAMQHTR